MEPDSKRSGLRARRHRSSSRRDQRPRRRVPCASANGHGMSEKEVAAAMEPIRTQQPGDASDNSAINRR